MDGFCGDWLIATQIALIVLEYCLSYSIACLHSLLVVSVALPSAMLRQWLLGELRCVEGSCQFRITRRPSCRLNFQGQVGRAHTLSKEFIRAPYSALLEPSTSRKAVADT